MYNFGKKIKKLLLPHVENNHRPDILHEHSLLTILTISLFSLLLSYTFYIILRETYFGKNLLANQVINLTNKARIEYGLYPLAKNNKLTDAAISKGNDMVSRRYFAHFAPDGTSPWDFIKLTGYNFVVAGENLAINFISSKKVVDAWLNSPKHRANIVNKNYKEIGVAIVPDIYTNQHTLIVVQMFGSQQLTANSNTPIEFYWYENILLNGSKYISYIYTLFVILLSTSLLMMITIETARKHRKHILYGFTMLITTLFCLIVNMLMI